MTPEESKTLLSFLYAHIVKPEFCTRVSWSKYQVTMWDNRSLSHKGEYIYIERETGSVYVYVYECIYAYIYIHIYIYMYMIVPNTPTPLRFLAGIADDVTERRIVHRVSLRGTCQYIPLDIYANVDIDMYVCWWCMDINLYHV